jgi:hypothetical protein
MADRRHGRRARCDRYGCVQRFERARRHPCRGHTTAEDKRRAAKLLADVMTETRQILIDDINGTAHRTLGSLPDMVYVIDTDGVVQFRGDWNEPITVEAVISGTADNDTIQREHDPPAKAITPGRHPSPDGRTGPRYGSGQLRQRTKNVYLKDGSTSRWARGIYASSTQSRV